MGLVEIQRALALLFTDAALRERFFNDPQRVGQDLGLSADDIQQVAQISGQQVRRFASSLHSKRLGEIYKLLPLTYKALGKQFTALFCQYADSYVPSGVKRHSEDAIAFATYIERRVVVEKGIAPIWVADVVRYEKARLLMGDVKRRMLLMRSHYALNQLIQSLERGDEEPSLLSKSTYMLWYRLSSKGNARLLVFTPPR